MRNSTSFCAKVTSNIFNVRFTVPEGHVVAYDEQQDGITPFTKAFVKVLEEVGRMQTTDLFYILSRTIGLGNDLLSFLCLSVQSTNRFFSMWFFFSWW